MQRGLKNSAGAVRVERFSYFRGTMASAIGVEVNLLSFRVNWGVLPSSVPEVHYQS